MNSIQELRNKISSSNEEIRTEIDYVGENSKGTKIMTVAGLEPATRGL